MENYYLRKRNLALWIKKKMDDFNSGSKGPAGVEYYKYIKMILPANEIIFEDLQECEFTITISGKEKLNEPEIIFVEMSVYFINRALELGMVFDKHNNEEKYIKIKPDYYNGHIEIIDIDGNKFFINVELV